MTAWPLINGSLFVIAALQVDGLDEMFPPFKPGRFLLNPIAEQIEDENHRRYDDYFVSIDELM